MQSKNMNATFTYIPSKILVGNAELLRQHSLTRWMSRDLMQATADYCKNIGLFPLYCETSPDHLARYLFWRLPQGAITEIRSGRMKEKFTEFDQAGIENNRKLVSLHVNESDLHSAVWISADHYETAKTVLTAYGITCAERKETD
jgi:hypothetical protein